MDTAQLRRTGLRHTYLWYVENYGLALNTVRAAHRRKWPLDDPGKLILLMMNAPGPTPNLQTLIDYYRAHRDDPR